MSYGNNLKSRVGVFSNVDSVFDLNGSSSESRFIPFVGGALLGGVLGSSYGRPYVVPQYVYYPYVSSYSNSIGNSNINGYGGGYGYSGVFYPYRVFSKGMIRDGRVYSSFGRF